MVGGGGLCGSSWGWYVARVEVVFMQALHAIYIAASTTRAFFVFNKENVYPLKQKSKNSDAMDVIIWLW